MPIHGIFYARFLPQLGTKIVAQSPPGCIVPVAVADESDDDFDPIHHKAPDANDGDAADDEHGDDDDEERAKSKQRKGKGKAPMTGGGFDSDSDNDDDANSDSDSDSDDENGNRAKVAAAAAPAPLGSNANISTSSFLRTPRGKPLFDFEVMQEYVIPRPAFFNRYLAARDPSGRYTVLGLPIAIRDSKYHRNEFIFNFGIVVDAGDDQGPYERVVRRLASTFSEMEKQNEFLSRKEQQEPQEPQQGGTTAGRGGIGGALAVGGAGGGSTSTNTFPSPAVGVGTGLGTGLGSGLGSGPGSGLVSGIVSGDDTPGFHAMAGAMGNSLAFNSIDGFFGRRRISAQSPTLGPQQQASQGGAGGNSRKVSAGKATAASTALYNSAAGPTMIDDNGHSPYHRRSIQSLLEIIREDLNLYGECMIPVDDANTINMKLFPIHPNPPAVEGWHVPVPKMRLADTVDPTWDLTLQRVIAHMDGVSDVRRIAFEADISMELCRSALRHLLYYDTILLLDIFFFGSCYAPRPGIHDFVANVDGIVDECARYVCLGRQDEKEGEEGDGGGDGVAGRGSGGASTGRKGKGGRGTGAAGGRRRPARKHDKWRPGVRRRKHDSGAFGGSVSGTTTPGDDSRDNTDYEDGSDDDLGDDSGEDSSEDDESTSPTDGRPVRVSNFDLIRLMTSFCMGRTVSEWLKSHVDSGFDVLRYVDVRRLVQYGVIKGCLYRVHKYVVSEQYLASLATGESSVGDGNHGKDPLQKYTDGQHHFDQIMTEQNLTEAELIERLKRMPLPAGDLNIIYR